MQLPIEPIQRRALRTILFVASAAGAAMILRFAWYKPWIAAGALLALFSMFVGRWIARRRTRKTLVSGDVEAVLREWSTSMERVPHASTMAPLMTATAFAANGWIDQAREALAAAKRGPAWEAALEHRIFLDALLLTFEGDRDEAIRQAERLQKLPVPDAPAPMRERIETLRGAVGALTRAFAHRTEDGDGDLLDKAAAISPLVFWAMRYANAVIAIDEGNREKAREYLDGAPDWPAQSAFRMFHEELEKAAAS